jgi:hypothetical protein
LSALNNQFITQYHHYLDMKEAFLDSFIDKGSDHDLFIASYIHGHFSVVAATLLNTVNQNSDESLDLYQYQEQTMLTLSGSIELAIANNELSKTDAIDVKVMLEALFKI